MTFGFLSKKSVFIVFTGDGKGKTTAALGQGLRAVGAGRRVLMVQFLKGPWKSGEDASVQKLAPDFMIAKMGRGFVGIMGDTLPREAHEDAARNALLFARREAESKTWNIIILDEVTHAVRLGLLTEQEVMEAIQGIENHLEHLIITGRDAPQSFIDRAAIVTEMRCVKHPFTDGVGGIRGLEY